MAHIPINHHLQPVYRVLAGAVGVYLIAFGVVFIATNGLGDLFDSESGKQVLGMKGNGGFAILSVVVGAIILLGVILGRNLDHLIDIWTGSILLVVATVMLALIQTPLNILAFSMTTVIVLYFLGMLLLAAGLYGKVGTPEQAETEEAYRHAG